MKPRVIESFSRTITKVAMAPAAAAVTPMDVGGQSPEKMSATLTMKQVGQGGIAPNSAAGKALGTAVIESGVAPRMVQWGENLKGLKVNKAM